jgi:protein required for attachment to host cells
MAKKTWILVAHKTGASLLEYNGKTNGAPTIIRSIAHPEGFLKSRDMKLDKPGTGINTRTGRHCSFDVKKKPERDMEKSFAAHLASMVNAGALAKKYDELILVADPRMLGHLREGLKKQTLTRLKEEVRKDFSRLKDAALIQRITPLVQHA